jgi:hypothetical protein
VIFPWTEVGQPNPSWLMAPARFTGHWNAQTFEYLQQRLTLLLHENALVLRNAPVVNPASIRFRFPIRQAIKREKVSESPSSKRRLLRSLH